MTMNIKKSKDLNDEIKARKKMIRAMKKDFTEKESQALDMSLYGGLDEDQADEEEGNFQLLKERKYLQEARQNISKAQDYATNIGEEMNRQNDKLRSFTGLVIIKLNLRQLKWMEI